MESSGRNGDDAERPAGEGPEHARLPLERSPEGRFVVRSSSHPPDEQTSGVDSSGVHSRPHSAPAKAAEASPQREKDRGRPGRSTPAERPRKRKELQQGGAYLANVRARCDTPRLLPGARTSDRPPSIAAGIDAAGVSQPAAPAASLAAPAASSSGHEERVGVDEVTRRVRRPSPVAPPSQEAGLQSSFSGWRGVVTAGVIVALLLLSVWLFG